MKRLIILMCTVSTLIVAQDAAGQYKLSGVNVLYTYVTRAENTLTVTDAYGFGITQAIATIPAAVPFYTEVMQLPDAALSSLGMTLFVTLNDDGSGAIADGSFYPDVETTVDEGGSCYTEMAILPVNDVFTYASMGAADASTGGYNVLGLPGMASQPGGKGLLGLSGSDTFDDYPMIPEHPTLCGPDGSCFNFTVGDIDQSGTIEVYPDVNLLGIPEFVPGGAPLTGVTGGFFLKRGLNTDDLTSYFPGNTTPDFYLEWHGVDGVQSGFGCGSEDDCSGETTDEDGDGTWFDRLLGIPGVTATYLNPACGFNQPVFGDVSEVFPPECVSSVDAATSGYLMDPSGALATWGNFLTAHAAIYQQCAPLFGAEMCASFGLLDDDSGYDVDPSCLADYNPADLTTILDCAGRLTMNFDIPCVGVIEAREVNAEFINVGGDACGTGDMNSDGSLNVLDVVALVNAVLTGGGDGCLGDLNGDGTENVLDVVALVNTVLTGGRVDGATSAEFNVIGNEVTMTADGHVGGIQMTLSHGSDFALTLTDGGEFSNYLTKGNTTTLIIVNPEQDNLFTASDDFTIESVIVSDVTGSSELSSSVKMPSDFSISAAYPNPFNPTTQMSITLNTAADVSVQVFNMTGQLVDVIASGKMSSGSYSFTWDAANAPSGVHFIQTEVVSEVISQKIMLVK